MIKKPLITLFLILSTCSLYANDTKNMVDSLIITVSKAPKDSILVNNYLYLSSYFYEKNLSKSHKYAKLALSEAKTLKYLTGKAQALFMLAQTEHKKGELRNALDNFKASTNLYAEKNKSYYTARGFAEIGNVYASLGEMVKAIESHQNAINIYSKLHNQVGVASSFSDIGKLHHEQKNYDQSINYFKKAKAIFQREKDESSLAKLYNRVSILFRDQGEIKKSLDHDYLALMIQEKLRDKAGMAVSNLNIGETSIQQKELKRAIGYIEFSAKLYREIEDQIGISKCQLITAKIYLIDNKPNLALENLHQCIQVAKSAGAVTELSEAYKVLSELYSSQENYENAYQYIVKHNLLRDTLFSNEKTKQFSSMEFKFQTHAKDKLVQKLEIENVQESNKALTITISFFFGTGIFIVILLVLRKRQKESQEINAHLERKNRLIEKKNNEILDSILYAKRIQEAMLTSKSYIERIFEEYLILYRPKDIVSGDFYWAYNNKNTNTIFWATADCTGHGVPGALMSMIGTVLLNEAVIVKKEDNPGKILTQINSYLKRYLNRTDTMYQTQDGMDIAFCKLHKSSLTLEVAGATHSVYVFRNEEITELKGDKITLGQDPYGRTINNFSVKNYQLQKGDVLYTFTDGFPDQIGGPNRKKYKVGALKNMLQNVSSLSLAEQRVEIKKSLSDWQGENPQLDDILIMGVKV